jgi:hypothetical protein
VALKQLANRGGSAWVAPLVDLVEQSHAHLLGLRCGIRAGRNNLA